MARKKKTTTIQPKSKINKLKHQFILTVRDSNGFVLDTVTNADYDVVLLEGMERAKDINGSWEVYNSLGKRLDGSYDRRRT